MEFNFAATELEIIGILDDLKKDVGGVMMLESWFPKYWELVTSEIDLRLFEEGKAVRIFYGKELPNGVSLKVIFSNPTQYQFMLLDFPKRKSIHSISTSSICCSSVYYDDEIGIKVSTPVAVELFKQTKKRLKKIMIGRLECSTELRTWSVPYTAGIMEHINNGGEVYEASGHPFIYKIR